MEQSDVVYPPPYTPTLGPNPKLQYTSLKQTLVVNEPRPETIDHFREQCIKLVGDSLNSQFKVLYDEYNEAVLVLNDETFNQINAIKQLQTDRSSKLKVRLEDKIQRLQETKLKQLSQFIDDQHVVISPQRKSFFNWPLFI
jgi:hypothetical protein